MTSRSNPEVGKIRCYLVTLDFSFLLCSFCIACFLYGFRSITKVKMLRKTLYRSYWCVAVDYASVGVAASVSVAVA